MAPWSAPRSAGQFYQKINVKLAVNSSNFFQVGIDRPEMSL